MTAPEHTPATSTGDPIDRGVTVAAAPPPAGPDIDVEAFIEQVTLGELEQLEDVTGNPLSKILREFETQQFSARVMTGIVWLVLRRNNPEATIDDARAVPIMRLADPATPAGETAGPK